VILMIVLGLFTTLFGVALGCMVLEITVRALVHSLTDHPAKGIVTPGGASRWHTSAWE